MDNLLTTANFGTKRLRKTCIGIFLAIMLFALFLFSTLFAPMGYSVRQILFYTGWLAIFVAAILFLSVYFLAGKINFVAIFILLAVLFSFGQSICVCFGWDIAYSELLNIANGCFSSSEIFDSSMTVLLMMTTFILFYAIFYYRDDNLHFTTTKKSKLQKKELSNLGWILLFISIVPTFYLSVKDFLVVHSSGYGGSKYDVIGIDKIFTLISGFFNSSLIILILCETNKQRQIAIRCITIAYFLLELLGGSRFDLFRFLVFVITLYVDMKKRLKGKTVIKFIIMAILIGILFSVISVMRQLLLVDSGSKMEYFLSNFRLTSAFARILSETGITQIFNTFVYQQCPLNVDYCYGGTIYKIFLGVVPNFGFWSVHPTGITTEVVFSPLYSDFGMGSSLWAEAYWNFGKFGSICFMALLGCIFARVDLSLRKAWKSDNSIVKFVIYYLIFYVSISVRSDMTQIGRDLLYYVIIPILLYKVFFAKQYKCKSSETAKLRVSK